MSAPFAPRESASPYRSFLEGKIRLATPTGFDVRPEQINPQLKPHVRALARWALKGGRRAIFASFGLQKTSLQIELMRQVAIETGQPVLIVAPLGVRQEFYRDAQLYFVGAFDVQLTFIRSDADLVAGTTDLGAVYINITNYESVRDGKVDPKAFAGATLDEAAILRDFGSKTFQEFLPLFETVPSKLVATAVPSPNRYKELIHYAGFLGVMDTGQALTRWFQRDPEEAGNLTLFPHKEGEFWLWVMSWAVFIQKPSDLGFSDDGYEMPGLELIEHVVPTDHSGAGEERDGQALMFRDAALGVTQAAAEKRLSLSTRIAKLTEIVEAEAGNHMLIWHDLEAERLAIETAVPASRSVYGSQELGEREDLIIAFSDGEIGYLNVKPQLSGSGCNFQRHCHVNAFLGIGHKFHDFIQAIHRTLRYGQTRVVRLHVIFTEAEREIWASTKAKWTRHDQMLARMSELVRRYGLDATSALAELSRSIGIERREVRGRRWTVWNNDCVDETRRMEAASVDLIVTSIPFANHYEYTDSYNDFGHTDDNRHFWRQMDFLTPELLRILKPGRLACIHVKDRVLFGAVTGAGLPTVSPFHAEAIFHYLGHGFDYCGMIQVNTDVVRENNQTYRLGWSENAKDSTKCGVGCPEYILLLHKPQSDRSRSYADQPVTKDLPLTVDDDGAIGPYVKGQRPVPGTGYSLARWQVDAHSFWRSSGDRLPTAEEMAALGPKRLATFFTETSLRHVYDHEWHVRIGEELAKAGRLPTKFMSLAPGSHDPNIWHDVNRMQTLNSAQASRRVEQHVCPLPFDIVDRLIRRFSNPDDLIFDPFGGVGTVPFRALKLGRRGAAVELHTPYFLDAIHYLEAEEREAETPTLFHLLAEPVAGEAA